MDVMNINYPSTRGIFVNIHETVITFTCYVNSTNTL